MTGCAKRPAGELLKESVSVGRLVNITATTEDGYWYRVETTTGIYFAYLPISGQRGAAVTIDAEGYMSIDGTPYMQQVAGFAP